MDREALSRWVEGAWRTPGTAQLGDLFSPDVSYRPWPWAPPVVGPEKLTGFWESERDGPDKPFVVASDVVAVERTTAVVRISVDHLGPDTSRWRDQWVLTFAQDGPAQRSRNGPSRPTSPTATEHAAAQRTTDALPRPAIARSQNAAATSSEAEEKADGDEADRHRRRGERPGPLPAARQPTISKVAANPTPKRPPASAAASWRKAAADDAPARFSR